MDTLFTKNWSKVTAIVHVPYINSNHLWEKKLKKKKKKNNAKTQRPIQILPKIIDLRQFLALPINVVMSFCTIRSSKNEGLSRSLAPQPQL